MMTLKKLDRHTTHLPQHRPIRVLQFGEGNFLRAFVDWMIDVLNEKTNFNGAVQVIQPIPQGMATMVNAQQGLYHVVLNGLQQGQSVKEYRMVTCLSEVINPFEDFKKYLSTSENPDLKFIVSNTTEAGIVFLPEDKDPTVLPTSFPGKLTILLYHRYKFFEGSAEKGLVIIPCELIDKNGEKLKEAIFQYIAHWNLPENFKSWITQHNIFCNSLVDRIVPGFPKDTIKEIQKEIGYEDNLVVTAEPFHLWVIEAPESVRGILPLVEAGLQVKFVSDQSPYRTRKVRILNGAHTAMVPVAYLHGRRTVKESIEDNYIGKFVRKAIFEEIIPTLDLPAQELEEFANDVIERFRNPYIRHELISISLNSVSKFAVRVLPSLLEYHKRKAKLPGRLVHSLAALIVFYRGEWDSQTIPLNDTPQVLDFFQRVWKKNNVSEIVQETLSQKQFWNTDLTTIQDLPALVEKNIETILTQKSVVQSLAG